MGRRKIAIEPLKNDRNRTVTFTKRKAGLFKKAHELAVLCEVDISVIIIGRNHKIYQYSSNRTEDVLAQYRANPNSVYESKTPKDYGNYELKSRILSDAAMRGVYPGGNNSRQHRQHRHSSSATSITTSSADLTKPELGPNANSHRHLRSRSDMINSSSYLPTGGSTDFTGDFDDEDDDDEDDDDEVEDDEVRHDDNDNDGDGAVGDYDDVHGRRKRRRVQRGSTADAGLRKAAAPSSSASSAGKKRAGGQMKVSGSYDDEYGTEEYPPKEKDGDGHSLTNIPKTAPYIYASPLDPKTPEMDLHSQSPYLAHSGSNVTPYHSSSALKRSKQKENNSGSNMKRPTLSLTIPTMDNRQLSDASTVTAAESSNKSNVTVLSNGKDAGTAKNDENLDLGDSHKKQDDGHDGGKQISPDLSNRGRAGGNDNMNITLPSPTFNLSYTTNSSNSSNAKNRQVVNNLNNSSTPLPSALFKDRKTLYTPTTSTFLNNLSMVNPSNPGETPVNQMGYFNFNNMSPTQLLVPPFPLPPLTTSNSSNNVSNDTQQNIRNTPLTGDASAHGEMRRNSGSLDKMNAAMNGVGGAASSVPAAGLATVPDSGQKASASSRITPSQTMHQPFLPPMNSATSAYFPQMRMPPKQRHPAHPTINTNVSTSELPTLSAELSALPSRYVDFQSPSTIFTHDWQLPTGTTPIVSGSHPLPLVSNTTAAGMGPSSASTTAGGGVENDLKLKTENGASTTASGTGTGTGKNKRKLSTVSR